jgi:hypothetical protein
MRKFGLLLAGVVGFLIGSRAGREPYEKLERQLSRLRGKPEVEDVMDTAKSEVDAQASDLTDKAKSKVSSASEARPSETQSSESRQPNAHAAI